MTYYYKDDDSKPYEGGLVRAETWDSYLENFGPTGITAYITANEDFADALDSILEKTKDFQDLKSELTELAMQRRAFIKYASDNMP